MLPALLLGVLLIICVVIFLRWYANAKTEEVKRSLRVTGLVLGGLIILVLAATGRLSTALAALVGLGAWAMRVFNMIQVGRQFTGMFKNAASGFGFGAAAAQNSDVRSAFFRMTLEHGTGNLDGEVLHGTFTGRRLSTLSKADCLTLRQECAADPDSLALLEAFMDRVHPAWRGEGASSTGAPPAATAMARDEACRVLGVKDDAGAEDIKAAYRRLMSQLHPDKGGSDYLAAKVNQAKDVLLKAAKK